MSILTHKRSGVYQIVNTVNGHCYIGSSANVSRRLSRHKCDLERGTHYNAYLQNAWNKYGASSFVFKPLFFCDTDFTLFFEQKCINEWKPEYNIAKDARASARGLKFSEEHKSKLGAKTKERWSLEEYRQRLSKALTGRKHSEETKQKQRAAWVARRARGVSEETRKKLSESLKGKRNSLGCHPSKETRQKISEALKGNKHTLGYKPTEETRKKLSKALIGNKRAVGNKQTRTTHSEEAKQKMRDAWKLRRVKNQGTEC